MFIIIPCLITYTVLKNKKESVLFFANAAFMTCHPHISDISHIPSWSWQNSACTASLLVSLSRWVCFWVLCVYVCLCANLCVCCSSSSAALACHSTLSLSGWKHRFDTWTDRAVLSNVPLQQFPPLWFSTLKCLCYKFSSHFPSLRFY